MAFNIHQEEVVHDTVSAALHDAVTYFAKGALVTSDPRVPSRTQPLTVAQATELLEVFSTLLVASPSDESRHALLRRTFESTTLTTLVSLVAQPLLFAPDVSAGYSLQQTFAQLRIAAIHAINKVVLFAAATSAMSSACCQAIIERRYVEGLLQLLSSPATFETLRVAASESLFVFVLRLENGRSYIVQTEALQMLFNCLVLEPAALVRNFFCSTVRELVNTHPTSLTDPKMIEILTKLMSLDESPDVRALTAETIDVVLRAPHASVAAANIVSTPADMVAAIKDRLDKDGNIQVLEAHARLFETLVFTTVAVARAPTAFFEVCAQLHIERSLVHALAHPAKAAAASARALRFFVQYAPSEQQVGYRIVTHFQTLSTLLKVAMDLTTPREDSADQSHQIECVEIGITLGMLLAQSPVYRQHIIKELHPFPMWSTTLRDGLIAFLNMAALDYYANMSLIDCTGVELNALAGVEWTEANKPRKSAIRGIFAAQEQRVREQRVERGRISAPPTMELEARRKERLTFILLNYAVHLTLDGADGADAATGGLSSATAAAGLPGTPRGAFDSFAAAGSPNASRRATSASRASALPKFPTPSSPRAGGGAGGVGDMSSGIFSARTQLSPQEREAMAFAYDKFDSGFKLVLDLAQFYGRKQKQQAQYAPTPDGFVVRQDKLRNPWGPVVKKESLKSWTVADLKEGDIFYFSLPFDELAVEPVKILIEKARRHCAVVKKNMITTPQTAKGRRWFLYDMLHNVMPNVIAALEELLQLVRDHGGDNVRFPLFLFREKEMHLGERAIHSGNLLQVVDQVKFYMAQNPNELVGVSASYIQHVQERMNRLRQQRFTGDEQISPAGSDDEGPGGYGHGGISSESDND